MKAHIPGQENGSARKSMPTVRPSVSPVTLARSSCACGGGCPRCQKKSAMPVSQPGDALEREADSVAEQVMRMPQPVSVETSNAPPRVSRASESAGQSASETPSAVQETLRESGQPLDASTRAFFEPRFGYDLGDVRVHADTQAAASAQSVSARAYTVGSDVVFNAGEYAPHSSTGRHLLAHELTHVVQQSRAPGALQRKNKNANPDCDPDNLDRLGKPGEYKKPETEVKGLGFTKKYVTKRPTPDADFVLYCPHASSQPLKKLVPCTNVYWIGDAEAMGKGKGKDEVWAQQAGETDLVWGYVKKKYIQNSECTYEPQGPPLPEGYEDPGGVLDIEPESEEELEPEDTDVPEPEEPTVEPPEITNGKTMRVNAPNDPGWASVSPNYTVFKTGEPFHFPHFLKVKVLRPHDTTAGYYMVEAKEGKYDGKDAVIEGAYLMDDPSPFGYAVTKYNVDTSEFFYGSSGPIKTAGTTRERAPPVGVHKLRVPDFPHDKALKYGPYATSWFLIGNSSDKYLHPGFASLGCATIEIKMSDVTTWPAIWTYLIDARKGDGVVGTIEIIHTPP